VSLQITPFRLVRFFLLLCAGTAVALFFLTADEPVARLLALFLTVLLVILFLHLGKLAKWVHRLEGNYEELNQFIVNIPEPVAVFDPETKDFPFYNDAFLALFPPVHNPDDPDDDTLEDKESICKVIEPLINGGIRSTTATFRKKSGDVVRCFFKYEPMKYGGEQVYIFTLIDLTERIEREEELRRLIEEIEVNKEMFEETAGKLAFLTEKLTESETMLKQTLSEKDKLFSIIAHDLRNPIAVIKGIIETLRDDEEMPQDIRQQFLMDLFNAGERAGELLENLLHWSRSQTGRIQFVPEIITASRIVHHAIHAVEAQAIKKELQVEISGDKNSPVNCDRPSMETVFRNLLSNAIKFSFRGNRIDIKITEKEEKVVIDIIDYGIGISGKNVVRLFKIDEAVSSVGTENEVGGGLGLILCKEFAEKNGGSVSVTSAEGKGSCFTVMLPRAERD